MSPPRPASTIRAAGGLVVRGDTAAGAQVVVVHRPRYDDWSIPKGKHDPGESSAECARREVWEETGYRCRLVDRAETTRYRVRGRPKEVDYYLMRPYRSSGFRPDQEVDELRWMSPEEAIGLLSYDFDRDLVRGLPVETIVSNTTVHLIRHGAAGDRSRWEGPDPERPLTAKGFAQAKALAGELAEVGVTRILASPYLRCVQTVEPLAEQVGVEVEAVEDLAEGAGPRQLDRLVGEMSGSTVVLSSHGDVIPALLERLQSMGVAFLSPYACQKGSTWVVGYDGLSFTDALYVPPPVV